MDLPKCGYLNVKLHGITILERTYLIFEGKKINVVN